MTGPTGLPVRRSTMTIPFGAIIIGDVLWRVQDRSVLSSGPGPGSSGAPLQPFQGISRPGLHVVRGRCVDGLATVVDPNPARNITPGLRRQVDPVSFLLGRGIRGGRPGTARRTTAQQAEHERENR